MSIKTNHDSFIIICDDYFSNRSGAQLIRNLVSVIAKDKYHVTVITPDFLSNKKEKENFQKKRVKIASFKYPNLKLNNKILRAILESILPIPLLFITISAITKKDYKGVIYYSPSIFIGVTVFLIKRIFKIKTYLIQRDLFPEWAVESKILKENSMAHKYFKIISKINYNAADKIGVMSKSSIKTLKHRGVNIKKIEVLPNWLSNDYLNRITTNKKFRINNKLENKTVFFYAGNFGKAQTIEYLFPIIEHFKENDQIFFVFFGRGESQNRLIEFCKTIPNANFYGNLEENEYYSIAKDLDVGLVCLNKHLKMSNYPGKCFGYMAMKKPFIGLLNEGNDMIMEIENSKIGKVSFYENNYKLNVISSVNFFSHNPSRIKEWGLNGFNLLSKNYSTEKTVKQILSILK